MGVSVRLSNNCEVCGKEFFSSFDWSKRYQHNSPQWPVGKMDTFKTQFQVSIFFYIQLEEKLFFQFVFFFFIFPQPSPAP